MGYTTVKELSGAIDAAARLAARDTPGDHADLVATLPLLVDQVQAEAGVAEPRLAGRALRQAHGDIARAVSLLRAWAATLPRHGSHRVDADELEVTRRITPAFREPDGGQYLGASLDYATRLLDVDDRPDESPGSGIGDDANGAGHAAATPPERFPRALAALQDAGYVAERGRASATDRTRVAAEPGRDRGALLQLLASAETGSMIAMAYTAIRGYGTRQDPTLVELRAGSLPVEVAHPQTGQPVRVGAVAATTAELVLYRAHDDHVDRRFTLGVGATLGRVERRAIAAALLDAGCARARMDAAGRREPSDDEEFLTIALDGQEATGFLEHLKLPHHVTFTSDLDRIRAVRHAAPPSIEETQA
ncbi:MAG: alpha-D-ribose 1-methylphosphonate 5-triphosphate synthase subunit PhnI [Solirubrobacteraceae bacterium]